MTCLSFDLKWRLRWLFVGVLSLPFAVLLAHDNEEDNVGVVSFNIDCSEAAQKTMNRAVAQLHNMMYVEAEGLFNEALALEPDCAMLHWGVAMTNFHPLWPGTTSAPEMERGAIAMNEAIRLGGANEREDAYIRAVSAFYEGGESTSSPERVAAWAASQKAVYEQFPDDIDAEAFFALSHLAVAPRGDKTFAHQKQAGTLLEALHANNTDHPAGFHYLIHAYDNPLLAGEAEAVSRAYDKLAPSVPHALHMPSHIFVRMGLWNETIFWNNRSAKAALDVTGSDFTTMHYAHAIDYKVYAHLQRGETTQAQAALDEMLAIDNHQNGFAAAYALAASPARIPLETDSWEVAANLPDKLHPAIDWGKVPAVVAINHFAQGIGAARAGDLEKAAIAEVKIDRLLETLKANGPAYWETLANSQHLSVQAWIAFAGGDTAKAEKLMLAAANAEDSVGKSPVTPSAVLPARELYGDMLILLDRHDEALTAYEATLSKSPNRARSLRGAMVAAMAAGDADKAKVYKEASELLKAQAQTSSLKTFVVALDQASGVRIAESQLAATTEAAGDTLEVQHGVSLLEEFRSADEWFQTFSALDVADLDEYLAGLEVTPQSIIESSFINSPEYAGGPKAGVMPREGHNIYVIERVLPGAGDAPIEIREQISLGSQGAIEEIGDGIEWDHSYVTGEGTYCVYRASDPELIEEHAGILDIPANQITEVEHIVRNLEFTKVSM